VTETAFISSLFFDSCLLLLVVYNKFIQRSMSRTMLAKWLASTGVGFINRQVLATKFFLAQNGRIRVDVSRFLTHL